MEKLKFPMTNVCTPWGTYEEVKDHLAMVKIVKEQLEWMRDHPEMFQPDPTNLAVDIRGYEEVLATNSNEVARAFFETKWEARRKGHAFKDNAAVIEHLKNTGVWTC